jgi:hypothetical protein
MRLLIVFLGCAAATWIGPHILEGADRNFSHQLHLGKAAATCVDCHVSTPASTAAVERNLPSAAQCAACHDGEKARKVDASWLTEEPAGERTYRFNHQFHLQMGNVAPILAAAIDSGAYLGRHEDRHHHMNQENACEACHRGLRETNLAGKENLPAMADCLVCHSKVDNPFSCSKCHLEGVSLRPASHTRDFVDLHATGKLGLDRQTCLPCHGRTFTCMGCH